MENTRNNQLANDSQLNDEQEKMFDKLVDSGGFNATEAMYMVGSGPFQREVKLEAEPTEDTPAQPRHRTTRHSGRPRTWRDKAAADSRPDLKPFPYGHKDSF
jgi:hypothetical protein